MTTPTPHKWAKEIHAFADGYEIEYRFISGTSLDNGWHLRRDESWDSVQFEFRFKPRTITRTVTYPQPLMVPPVTGKYYWFLAPYICRADWRTQDWQVTAYKNGMLFATESDAQQCYEALFGATE